MSVGEYDVVVVGGGIHGTLATWEAARRGLRVALVEAEDFGHATSGNSLHLLHGGLRYLRQLGFERMRESVRERREWLRIAREVVKPMGFVRATVGYGLRGPAALRVALLANDLVGYDRNDGVWADRHIPRAELWNASRARQFFAGTSIEGLNGAAVWYDAVCLNTERLQMGILAAAAAAGAQVANYARATEIRHDSIGASGLHVRDETDGHDYLLRTRSIINAAGPWVDGWLAASRLSPGPQHFVASKAFCVLTRPLPFADAVALPCSSTYFAIPWNGRTLIGTRRLRCERNATQCVVTPEDVQAFLNELNAVLGRHRIAAADVRCVFSGLVPEREKKKARVVDHGRGDGMPGLYSIIGTDWTTSRSVAERAIGMACDWMRTPRQTRPQPALRPEVRGADAPAILDLIAQQPSLGERVVRDVRVVKAQIVYAARAEMALCLWDVIRRRVPLYLSDMLDAGVLETCAGLMARELGWSRTETARQVEHATAGLQNLRGPALGIPARQAAPSDDTTTARTGCAFRT